MSRVLKPLISNWSIGWNKRELVWTSMGPKCDLDSPSEIASLCQSQIYLPNLTDTIKDRLPHVARAMHYQHFPGVFFGVLYN
jgi:hypothetical protein